MSFQDSYPLFTSFYLNVLSSVSNKIWNSTGDSGHCCLIPVMSQNNFCEFLNILFKLSKSPSFSSLQRVLFWWYTHSEFDQILFPHVFINIFSFTSLILMHYLINFLTLNNLCFQKHKQFGDRFHFIYFGCFVLNVINVGQFCIYVY